MHPVFDDYTCILSAFCRRNLQLFFITKSQILKRFRRFILRNESLDGDEVYMTQRSEIRTRHRAFLLSVYGLRGSRDGAVVRALASHQCRPESIPELRVTCRSSLLLVLVLAPRGFSPFSRLVKNKTFPNSNSIRNLRATGLSVITDY